MATQRYRCSINGFWCRNETWDDALNWDGKHDEVFIAVNTKVADGTGAIHQSYDSLSEVMGDTWQIPNRVLAGSASPNGGIVSGDKFPSSTPWVRSGSLNTLRYPPYQIWEGNLTSNQEVVLLTPTIWEWDPGAGFWNGWLAWQVGVDQAYGTRAKEIVGGVWPVAKPVFDAVSLGLQTANTLAGLWSPLGQSQNRPIGIQRDPNNNQGFLFNPAVIAITYDTAEYIVNNNLNGLGNGVLEITYVDDPYLRGVYSIFVQIERVSSVSGSEQDDWRWCNKCQGLFWNGGRANSRCPAGGTHDPLTPVASSNYVLQSGIASDATHQHDWRWCNKCQGLFFGGGIASSVCPAGGAHDPQLPVPSGDYALQFGLSGDGAHQSDWRWCNKCQGLFWGGGSANSVCPAGGHHDATSPVASSDYLLAHK